jgi:predicted RNA binding protein YcfA (HicA-like mRNA interferase family)
MSILPTLRARKVINALKKAGFVKVRQSGSHVQLRNSSNPRYQPTVPIHSKDLSRQVVRSIIRQAGLSVKEFLKLLDK